MSSQFSAILSGAQSHVSTDLEILHLTMRIPTVECLVATHAKQLRFSFSPYSFLLVSGAYGYGDAYPSSMTRSNRLWERRFLALFHTNFAPYIWLNNARLQYVET